MIKFFKLKKEIILASFLIIIAFCLFVKIETTIAESLNYQFSGSSSASCDVVYPEYNDKGISGNANHSGSLSVSVTSPLNIPSFQMKKYCLCHTNGTSVIPCGCNDPNLMQEISYKIGANFQNAYYEKISLSHLVSSNEGNENYCNYKNFNGNIGAQVQTQTIGSCSFGNSSLVNSGNLFLGNSQDVDSIFSQDYEIVNNTFFETLARGSNPSTFSFSSITGQEPTQNWNSLGGIGNNNFLKIHPLYPLAVITTTDDETVLGFYASDRGIIKYYTDFDYDNGEILSASSGSYAFQDKHINRVKNYETKAIGSYTPFLDCDVLQPRSVVYYSVPEILKGFCSENQFYFDNSEDYYSYYYCPNLEPNSENITNFYRDINNYRNLHNSIKVHFFQPQEAQLIDYRFPSDFRYFIEDRIKEFVSQVPASWTESSVITINKNDPLPNALSCTVSASLSEAEIGEQVIWQVNLSGLESGATVSYMWSGSDGLSGNSVSIAKTYNNPGYKYATVSVLAKKGTKEQKAICSNTVNILDSFRVSCFGSPNPAAINDLVQWVAVPKGGVGNYLYEWSGDLGFFQGQNPQNSNFNIFSTTYKESGNKTVKVTVSSGGKKVTSECNLEVVENQVLCESASPSYFVNQPVLWLSKVLFSSSNASQLQYVWSGDDGLWGNTPTVSKTYDTVGEKEANLTVTFLLNPPVSTSTNCSVKIISDADVSEAKPTLNKPEQVLCNEGKIELSWSVPSLPASSVYQIKGYKVYVGDNFKGEVISPEYLFIGKPGELYKFSVSAVYLNKNTNESIETDKSDPQFQMAPGGCTCKVYNEAGDEITETNTNTTVKWQADFLYGSSSYTYLWSGHPEIKSKTQNPLTVSYESAGTKLANVLIASNNKSYGVSCPSLEVKSLGEPTVTNIEVVQPNYCNNKNEIGPDYIIFKWTYSGDNTHYKIKITAQKGSNYLSTNYLPVDQGFFQYNNSSFFSYNSTYQCFLYILDTNNSRIIQTHNFSFTTPKHSFPKVDFLSSYNSQTQTLTVKDKTPNDGSPITNWEWSVNGDNGESFSFKSKENTIKFNTAPQQIEIKLQAWDNDGYGDKYEDSQLDFYGSNHSCCKTQTIEVSGLPQLRLPKWKEVRP